MRGGADGQDAVAARLFRLSIGVFFIGGFVASSVGLLVPRVRLTLGLDYAAATQIQLASYSSYLVFALPIAAVVSVWGYMRAHAAGLALMAAACLLLVAGFASRAFPLVLASLLILSAGQTVLQIASNTVSTMVGDPARAAFRLNLLQGFNAVGTVAGPLVGARFIVAEDGGGSLLLPFGGAALLLLVLVGGFFASRRLLNGTASGATHTTRQAWAEALRDRRLLAGAGAIFAYVGAEVTIGALLTDFLMSSHALALSPSAAARLVAVYWGAAMIGRFAGAALMRHVAPPILLSVAAGTAVVLVGLAVGGTGLPAAAALLGVGLFNSVMYPTIYVLALPRRPEQATAGATILCMAVVGGAIVPHVTGLVADRAGLVPALILPGLCYLPVLLFAVTARRHTP